MFTLLEAVFQGFDSIAKRQGVFKVETIGDCYVGTWKNTVCVFGVCAFGTNGQLNASLFPASSAVCGVPKANKEHAVVMAQFARDAMDTFCEVVYNLELTLGPDTVGTCRRCLEVAIVHRLTQIFLPNF